MNTRTQQVLLHLAGCMVVLTLPLLFSPESVSLRAYLMNPPTQKDILFYALILAVFYLNYYGLIPTFYFRRQYLILLLINVGCFFAVNFLSGHLIDSGNPHPPGPPFPGSSPESSHFPSPPTTSHLPADS